MQAKIKKQITQRKIEAIENALSAHGAAMFYLTMLAHSGHLVVLGALCQATKKLTTHIPLGHHFVT